jgi:hypothetical protein
MCPGSTQSATHQNPMIQHSDSWAYKMRHTSIAVTAMTRRKQTRVSKKKIENCGTPNVMLPSPKIPSHDEVVAANLCALNFVDTSSHKVMQYSMPSEFTDSYACSQSSGQLWDCVRIHIHLYLCVETFAPYARMNLCNLTENTHTHTHTLHRCRNDDVYTSAVTHHWAPGQATTYLHVQPHL